MSCVTKLEFDWLASSSTYLKLKSLLTNQLTREFWYHVYRWIQKMTKSVKIEKKLFRVNLSNVNFLYDSRSLWQSTSRRINHYVTSTSIYKFANALHINNSMWSYSESQKWIIFIWLFQKTTSSICSNWYETFNERKFYYRFNIIQSIESYVFHFTFLLFCRRDQFRIRWLIIKIHHDVFHCFFVRKFKSSSTLNSVTVWRWKKKKKKEKMNERNSNTSICM